MSNYLNQIHLKLSAAIQKEEQNHLRHSYGILFSTNGYKKLKIEIARNPTNVFFRDRRTLFGAYIHESDEITQDFIIIKEL